MLYLDTSILLAYYCPETFTDAVTKLLTANPRPAISPLNEVEFASAVSLKVRSRQLDRRDAGRLLILFRKHISDGLYQVAPIESRHFSQAGQWLEQCATPLRSLDALHMAVAFFADATLATADQRLAESAAHFGVKHRRIG